MKIFVIQGKVDVYEDAHIWPARAFYEEKQANDHIEKIKMILEFLKNYREYFYKNNLDASDRNLRKDEMFIGKARELAGLDEHFKYHDEYISCEEIDTYEYEVFPVELI